MINFDLKCPKLSLRIMKEGKTKKEKKEEG
jgi:hypothetical protein